MKRVRNRYEIRVPSVAESTRTVAESTRIPDRGCRVSARDSSYDSSDDIECGAIEHNRNAIEHDAIELGGLQHRGTRPGQNGRGPVHGLHPPHPRDPPQGRFPRTSGLEVRFLHGELWLGMMPDSLKALDLRRDPRFALQANQGPGTTMAGGDVRISGRAYEADGPDDSAAKAAYVKEVEPPEPFHLFRTELTEVVRTYVEDDKYLVVEIWKPGEPVRTLKRT